MDNCCVKPGLCLPRWIAATVGSWMFWIIIILIIIIPLEGSSSCPDVSGVDIPCPLNELAGVNCTYVKGIPDQLPGLPPGDTNHPGSVKHLNVQPFLKNGVMYMNITWKIDASDCRNLNGFILNATFMFEGIQRYIYRTYALSVEDWSNRNIYETAFRHECIVPSVASQYRIEVHSLPLSTSTSGRDNAAVIYYEQGAAYHSPDIPAVSTFDWVASMWTTRISAEDRLGDVDICFNFAPLSFGFKEYRMDLLRVNASVFQLSEQTVFIYDNGTQKRHECVTFENVCPGIYAVYVMPVAKMGSCTCRAGPNDCRDSCTATVYEPIDMTESVCKSLAPSQPSSTTSPAPPSPPNTTTLPPPPPPTSGYPLLAEVAAKDSDRKQTVGIVVVVVTVAVVVVITSAVVVVVVVILVILRRRREKVPFGNSAVVPFLSLEKQPST